MKNIKILVALGTAWIVLSVSGFAADKIHVGNISSETGKAPFQARALKLEGIEVDLGRLEKDGGYELEQGTRKKKMRNGKDVDVKVDRRARYFPKSKRIAYIESVLLNDAAQGEVKVYDLSGKKVFEKKLEAENGVYRDFQDIKMVRERYVAVFIADVFTDKNKRLEVYDTTTNKTLFVSTFPLASTLHLPPSDDYFLLRVKDPSRKQVSIYKYDFKAMKKVIEDEGVFFAAFSNDGRKYVVGKTKQVNIGTTKYPRYKYTLSLYTDDLLAASADTGDFEFPKEVRYSAKDTYIIVSAETDAEEKGNKILTTPVYTVIEAATAKILAQGKLSLDIVEEYVSETIIGRGK